MSEAGRKGGRRWERGKREEGNVLLPQFLHSTFSKLGHVKARHGVASVVVEVGFVFHHVEFLVELGE